MRYPNIYLVGAPKCGTTSLHYHLGQHPSIFAPKCKEPHYHTVIKTGWPSWDVRSQEQYFTLYKEAQCNQLLLDASAWNLYAESSAKFIYETSPNAYIIMSLRQPVQRAYSHFMHMVQRGWEKYYLFEEAIAQEEQRIEKGFFWDVHYLSAGYYASQVQRYLSIFPRQRIKILIFEEWIQNPEDTIQEIFRFLNIDKSLSVETKKVKNVTQISYAQSLRIWLKKYREIKFLINSVVPGYVKRNIMNELQQKKTGYLHALNPDLEMDLMNRYLDDIEILEKLLERSVESWHVKSN